MEVEAVFLGGGRESGAARELRLKQSPVVAPRSFFEYGDEEDRWTSRRRSGE
jgi:hypothetical protein